MAMPYSRQKWIGNIALAGVAFIAGVALDRVWLGMGLSTKPSSNSASALSIASQSKRSDLARDGIHVAQAATEQVNLTSNLSKIRSYEGLNEDPTPVVLSDLLDAAEELSVESAVRSALPMGTRTDALQPDGSVDEYFVSNDGTNAFRQKNPQGQVMKDGWTTPTGDNYYRTFYKTGEPKLVSINRSTGSQTTLTFDENGNRETRFDKRADDQSISITYDSKGKVRDIWQIGRDGKSDLLYPEP